MSLTKRLRPYLIGAALVLAAIGGLAAMAISTAPTRGAVRAYSRLLAAANSQDIEGARAVCSSRYNLSHPLKPAADGGIVGLPRNIHKNFKVWKSGRDVWLCPTNRTGPVYQFVKEGGEWRFDGPIGNLMPGNVLVRLEDSGAAELPEGLQAPDGTPCHSETGNGPAD